MPSHSWPLSGSCLPRFFCLRNLTVRCERSVVCSYTLDAIIPEILPVTSLCGSKPHNRPNLQSDRPNITYWRGLQYFRSPWRFMWHTSCHIYSMICTQFGGPCGFFRCARLCSCDILVHYAIPILLQSTHIWNIWARARSFFELNTL